ncbi:phosphotransferase [Allobacillus sp. GCM10007491]|uniref:Phosphotransferase n=1 Tax=Allobacillus saliphilus TaxID=2912308 RepID=A0A941CS45_9BACI|nr:phosphotransferase [Allobacillus saliphilus]
MIKLAKPNTGEAELQREYKNTLAVWELGLPVPQPFGVLYVGKRPGLVVERIHGMSPKERLFHELLQQDEGQLRLPTNDIKETARMLSQIHQHTHTALPSQRDYIARNILSVDYLTNEEKQTILSMMDAIPIKQQICHGDPNPNNIIVSNRRHFFIDWNDTTIGNPEADIAEYIVMMRHAILPPETPSKIIHLFNQMREGIIQVFVKEYMLHSNIIWDEIEPWLVIIAARKLHADAILEEEKKLLVKEIRKKLKDPEPQ